MSRCKRCGGTGWVESHQGAGASWTPSLQQCPERCNISGYSQEVMRRLNNPKHVTERPVIQAIPSERTSATIIPFVKKELHPDE